MANKGSTISFPGQVISPNPPITLVVPAGGSVLVPNGNWLFKVPPQSALQYLDSDSGLWRILEAGLSGSPIQIASDGTNYKVLNLSSTITGANVTAAGTLYNQANATATFAAPSAGNTAAGYPIVGGSLSFSLTATGANGVVASGGTGYTSPVIIMPEPQQFGAANGFGISASVSATLTAGVISSLTVAFAGAGYANLPANLTTKTITPAQFAANPDYWLNTTNIIIVDPTGTGANIVPSITNGTSASGGITGIVMTNPGSGYSGTTIPAVTIAGTTGSSGTATALPSLALTGVTIGSTNTGYTASVELLSSLGSGTAIARVNDESILPRAAKVVVPQSGGVLASPVIEDAGSGFQTVPLLKQVGNATADGSVNATFVAVVGGVVNTLILWQVG